MIDLSVRGLVKGFEQGNDILKGITFDVNAGERVGILGRNGCGKTTFFRILSGELQPDAGTVSIASGRRLGLISQIPVYPDGWTTEDVLREAHSRLRAIAARIGRKTMGSMAIIIACFGPQGNGGGWARGEAKKKTAFCTT